MTQGKASRWKEIAKLNGLEGKGYRKGDCLALPQGGVRGPRTAVRIRSRPIARAGGHELNVRGRFDPDFAPIRAGIRCLCREIQTAARP